MRRMLDPKEVGGLPSTIEFDKEGNRTVGNNLGVDGKLKLKSLVSESNPDGDITKELGGGGNTLYEYSAVFRDTNNLGISRNVRFYSSVDTGERSKDRTSTELYTQLLPAGSGFELSLDAYGSVKMTTDNQNTFYPIIAVSFNLAKTCIYYLDPSKGKTEHPNTFWSDSTKWYVIRNIASPRKAN